jgi:hypothetical protein
MSEPERLPVHLRSLTIEIPRCWTAEEALAVFELIDDLRDKVWTIYADRLQTLLKDRQGCHDVDDSRRRDEPSF